jgi:hypothetical protein
MKDSTPRSIFIWISARTSGRYSRSTSLVRRGLPDPSTGLVGLVFWSSFVHPQGSSSLCTDETTSPCAFDVVDCHKYDSTPTHSAIVRCEPRDDLLSGVHVPDGRSSCECGQLRSHCTRRCRFTGTNSKYTLNWRSSESRFSLHLAPLLKYHPS